MRVRFLLLFLVGFNFIFAQDSKLENKEKDSLPIHKIVTQEIQVQKNRKVNKQYSNEIVRVDTVYLESAAKTKSTTQNIVGKEIKDEANPLQNIGEIFSFWKIFWAIVLLVSAHYLIRLIILILERFNKRRSSSNNLLKNAAPLIRFIGWTLTIVIVIEGIFSPPKQTLIAVFASAGIAIGFAAQDILKNIFGGIMILFDRPFQIGDKIEVGNYYGEVIEIGLRSTRIVTSDDSLVSIPNSEVVNTAVSNANAGENNCQVVAEIYLPINIDTDLVRQIATETAQISRYIYLNKPITVLFFNEVKERRSYIKMRLKAYVSDLKHEFSFKSDMTEIFLKELLERKIITKEELF